MKINILTLFPEMFAPLTSSMLGRAADKGILEFNIVNIRDFSQDKHCKADDYPFGGGHGMVLMADPAFRALESVGAANTRNIYMSPRGKILDMKLSEEFASENEITVFCGHYEGIDQRIIDAWDMQEVSIGDYILTGGELAAMVLIDTVSRMVPEVLPKETSAFDESIYSGLLEYPQYTQPRSYRGMDVPEVLVSGNHKLIALWKFEQSLALTKARRPEIFEQYVNNRGELSKDELKVLEKFLK